MVTKLRGRILAGALLLLGADGSLALASAQCSLPAVEAAKAEFNRLSTRKRFDPAAVSDAALSNASLTYVARAEACFDRLYGRPGDTIDVDGVVFDDGVAQHNLAGRKWGAGTSYSGFGNDNGGPRLAGGTVTYSFMGDGVDMTADSLGGAAGANVSLSALPSYSACFLTDIAAAFAAWSAVANIQFVQVPDNGIAFNATGATGDIRIGAHTFDGPSSVLAHAYYPPPNGTSSSGDMHFDREEHWGCTAGSGVVDIGIVALHEIGHSIGLGHETRVGRRAVMNPTYNPSVASVLLGDDINGGTSIYGSSFGASDDLVLNFGAGGGLWRFNYGVGWAQIHPYAAEGVSRGDLDGNGIDDLVVDFGGSLGVWLFLNNTNWAQLHVLSPARTVVGDLDGNGKDDVVLDFPGVGVYAYYNCATWAFLHPTSTSLMAIGNLDGTGGDELIVDFPGQGVWAYYNNATWTLLHGLDASLLATGWLDTGDGRRDLLLGFPSVGLYQYANSTTWSGVHPYNPVHLAVGDLDTDGRDDLTIDFGPGLGIYTLLDGTTWTLLHGGSSRSLTMGDLDGNGRDEVVIDFGPGIGIWAWVNGSTWLLIHGGTTTSDLLVGDFN